MADERWRELFERAKTRLMVRRPYFGLLASRLDVQKSDEVGSWLSDGRILQINDDYFGRVSSEVAEFALANSVMHHVLAHEGRRMGRQGWLWQLATDYAINGMLRDNGFEIPEGANFDERFAGMYAEAIYATLKDEIKNEEYSDDESHEEGFNEQNKNRQKEQAPAEENQTRRTEHPLPPAELDPETLESWARAMEEALRRAEAMGDRPEGLTRLFARDRHHRIDWRSELYHAIDRHYKSDYTYLRPNKKMIASGLYLPATTSERMVLAVAIDSSGSVDEALLSRFVGELEGLLLSFERVEVDLLVCDAKIQSLHTFRSGEPLDVAIQGGGGTDFRPVFDHLMHHLPQTNLLLYFTDALGRFPETPPPFETIWVVPEGCDVPFGRTIVMEGGKSADRNRHG